MKDLKLLLAGFVLLLLIIFAALFLWLWTNNSKNIDPLPIASNGAATSDSVEAEEDNLGISTLHIQAEDTLQIPLDNVIIKFESRYPKIQILTNYVPTTDLLTLPKTQLNDDSTSSGTNIDIIFADQKLSQDQLLPLQLALDDAYSKLIKNNDNEDDRNTVEGAKKQEDNTVPNLTSFSYALKDEQTVDGVVLTDNPTALTFRNFILSSVGQDILKRYDYDNIDGYKNSMEDLFNPTSRAKSGSDTDESSVKIADALSNGQ